MDRTLRWMQGNLLGAYDAVDSSGHHSTNSGTCIIVSCYIGALGKVLLKGARPQGNGGRDYLRFKEFLDRCMKDFIAESANRTFPTTPHGKTTGDGWLYEVYRCGFVHSFYPSGNLAWARARNSNRYWFTKRGRLVLNIDRLVKGFRDGLVQFRQLAVADPDLRSQFMNYLLAP